MKDFAVKVENFKLGKFIKDVVGFLTTQADEPLSMFLRYETTEKNWNMTDDIEKEIKLKKEVLSKGVKLYFLFSSTGESTLSCADGVEYDLSIIPEKDNLEFDDLTTIGWTVEYKYGKLVFNSAASNGGMGRYDVDLMKDMKYFEKPMKKFLQKYISR